MLAKDPADLRENMYSEHKNINDWIYTKSGTGSAPRQVFFQFTLKIALLRRN